MPKKAQLPPGAAGRSQQTLARRNRRDALGKWLPRSAGVAARTPATVARQLARVSP